MRRARLGVLAVLLFATSTLAGVAATALGATIVNATSPFAATTVSDCTGESVAVEGEMHTLVRFGQSGDRQHFGFDVHLTGVTGIGLVSGARYTEMDVQNTQANVTPLGPQEFTAERTMNLTRLGEDTTFGDGDDMRLHVIAHMTVDANGVVRVDKTDATNECR